MVLTLRSMLGIMHNIRHERNGAPIMIANRVTQSLTLSTVSEQASAACAAWVAAERKRCDPGQLVAADRVDVLTELSGWVAPQSPADALFAVCSLHSLLTGGVALDEEDYEGAKKIRSMERILVQLARYLETTGPSRAALGFDFLMDPRLDVKNLVGPY